MDSWLTVRCCVCWETDMMELLGKAMEPRPKHTLDTCINKRLTISFDPPPRLVHGHRIVIAKRKGGLSTRLYRPSRYRPNSQYYLLLPPFPIPELGSKYVAPALQ